MEKKVINPPRVRYGMTVRKVILALFYLVFFHSFSGHPQQGTFTNPIRDGADPWVFQKGSDYYYCASEGGGISVSKSNQLTDHGTMIKVWDAPDQGWNAANIWAPELHYIDGNWYIYYAAGEKPGGPFIHQKSGVLKSEGEDPFGPYLDKGMLYTGDDLSDPTSVRWAIDLSPMEFRGQWYAIGAGG